MNLKIISIYILSYYIAYLLLHIQRLYYVDIQKYLIEKKELHSFDSPGLHLTPIFSMLYSWEAFGSQLKHLSLTTLIGTATCIALGFMIAPW